MRPRPAPGSCVLFMLAWCLSGHAQDPQPSTPAPAAPERPRAEPEGGAVGALPDVSPPDSAPSAAPPPAPPAVEVPVPAPAAPVAVEAPVPLAPADARVPLASPRDARPLHSSGERRWRAAVDAGTDFPAGVVVRGQLEAPFRLRASTALGALPPLYADAINAFLVAVDAYDDDTATLIDAALRSSLVWRTHAGFRFVPRLGLFAEAGYGLITLGGNATGAELIAGIAGQSLPRADAGHTFSARSTLHMLDVEVGYEWFLARHLHLRTALGGAFTVGARTTIEPDYTPVRPALTEELASYGESYLDDVYTSYVFTPVVSVHVGYGW